jgi:hypothetical protein
MNCPDCGASADPLDPANLRRAFPQARAPDRRATQVALVCPNCKRVLRITYPSWHGPSGSRPKATRSEPPRYFDFCSFCDRRRDFEERLPNGPTASICSACLTQCEDVLARHAVTSETLDDTLRCGLCSPPNQGSTFVMVPGVLICDLCIGRCRVLLDRLPPSSREPAPADTKRLSLSVVKFRIPPDPDSSPSS